jgi:hypothetical protein
VGHSREGARRQFSRNRKSRRPPAIYSRKPKPCRPPRARDRTLAARPGFKLSLMGTRIGIPGWVPYQGLGTPLFFAHPSVMATHRPRSKGPGPVSLLQRYGAVDRSIDFGVPFWKRWGCSGDPSGWGEGAEAVGIQPLVSKPLSRPKMRDQGLRHVVPLRRWLCYTDGGNIEKGKAPTLFRERHEIPSTKISTVSSLQ